jgi:hypothetical protein
MVKKNKTLLDDYKVYMSVALVEKTEILLIILCSTDALSFTTNLKILRHR